MKDRGDRGETGRGVAFVAVASCGEGLTRAAVRPLHGCGDKQPGHKRA